MDTKTVKQSICKGPQLSIYISTVNFCKKQNYETYGKRP